MLTTATDGPAHCNLGRGLALSSSSHNISILTNVTAGLGMEQITWIAVSNRQIGLLEIRIVVDILGASVGIFTGTTYGDMRNSYRNLL